MNLLLKKSAVFCLLILYSLILACSENKISAEDEIKQYIDKGTLAAENRSHSQLGDLIDKNYRDHKNLDKEQLIKMARAYFFMHKNIHVFTKIKSIDLQNENTAFVVVYAAIAGTAIADINSLTSLRARIYKFELLLTKKDEWLLQQARWQRADLKDMLSN